MDRIGAPPAPEVRPRGPDRAARKAAVAATVLALAAVAVLVAIYLAGG